MECIRKEYTDKYLSISPKDDGDICSNGSMCVVYRTFGVFLHPFISPQGECFNSRCLVCIREYVYDKYLEAAYSDDGCDEIFQPWYNSQEDYHDDCFIIPNRCTLEEECVLVGIIAPFFRHSLSKYTLLGNVLKESDDFDYNRIDNIFYERTELLPKLYDKERFRDSVHDASFLVIISALITPQKKKNQTYICKLVNRALFETNDIIEDDVKSEPIIQEWVDLHYHGKWPWCHPDEVKSKHTSVSVRLAILEAIVFFVEDDATLSLFIRRKNGEWGEFVKHLNEVCTRYRRTGEINWGETLVLRQVYPIFWNRSVERFKNKQLTGEKLNPERARQGIYLLKQGYDRNPLNARVDDYYLNDVCQVLRLRRRIKSNRIIPLPYNFHSKIEHFFVCEQCEQIKALTQFGTEESSRRKKKKQKLTFSTRLKKQGSSNVYWYFPEDICCCYRKRSGGRQAKWNFYRRGKRGSFHCEVPCKKVEFGRNVVNVKNVAYVTCLSCSFICYLNGYYILSGGKCVYCREKSQQMVYCSICTTTKNNKSKSSNWFYIDTLVDGGFKPVERLWFCGKHKGLSESHTEQIWSAPILQKRIIQHSLS